MSLIILRLHPVEPADAIQFELALRDLKIVVSDIGFGNLAGNPIGDAEYLILPDFTTPQIPDPATGIVQHVVQVSVLPPIFNLLAVATAVIEDTTGPPEHATRDLMLEIHRGVGEIIHRQVYYNVPVSPLALPGNPAVFPFLQPTSLHLTLPAAGQEKNAGDAFVDLPADGTPPSFDDVLGAIQVVLSNDPSVATDIAGLTLQQCRHIAYEIAWNRNQFPLPDRDKPTLERLYTAPDNSNDKQDREEFEGQLVAYYAKHNAEAERLTGFVFAVSAAILCQNLSGQETEARFRFPVRIGAVVTTSKIKEAEVILRGAGGALLNPSFEVPAAYFYALGAVMSPQITPEQRYTMAILDDEKRVRDELTRAIDLDIIDEPPAVNRNQAARRLNALGTGKAGASVCEVSAAVGDPVHDLIQDWLNFTPLDIAAFWVGATPVHDVGHLNLVLCAITAGHTLLIAAIKAPPFSVGDVTQLAAKTAQQWSDLFIPPAGPPLTQLLPPFTKPGSIAERVAAFIRHVKKFFEVTAGGLGAPVPSVDAAPTLSLAEFDPVAEFFNEYNNLFPGFTFGSAFNEGGFQTALSLVFPNDPPARAWLEQAMRTLNDLYILAQVGITDLRFSITEALYARGFTSAKSVRDLTLDDFQDALTGTVAFDHAALIYQNAGGAPGTAPSPPPEEFTPVNPDGLLINCIPPPHLSPVGAVAYLKEMLQVSEAATCANPFPDGDIITIANLIAARRGPIGDLHVTEANLQTPLPLIDIVNECLEAMAATSPPTPSGVIYDSASDELGGHQLQKNSHTAVNANPVAFHHDPAMLFEVLPEHSTPATPIKKPAAYDVLKSDFSAPLLPYSQPLDITRSYLRQFGASRFSAMRAFRKDITEFVLDPANEPALFQRHLWRYPVRIGIAREYLHINPEEFDLLFTQEIAETPTAGRLLLRALYGFDSDNPGGEFWLDVVVKLSEFLVRTGLTYCEFLALWKSEFVKFHRAGSDDTFPDCEPCCLADYQIEFDDPANPPAALKRLAVFIRLWRKLQTIYNAHYSFAELRDICEVLRLYDAGGAINPDFVRQLAAFQMLRDDFKLAIADAAEPRPNATGDDRTHLLALWVGTGAVKWLWAVDELLDRIQRHAQTRYKCGCRSPEFIRLLGENLDALSRLAGFDPTKDATTWHALPTHTLRFAEILAKIYASDFGVGEILFLFTADDHLQGDDPFPLQSRNEALDLPFDLPDDQADYSLWALRRKLLNVKVSDEDAAYWSWSRIDTSLRLEFGYAPPEGTPDALLSLGEHFFPHVLESDGIAVGVIQRQYRADLAVTAPLMWNTPPDGPFRYDVAAQQLWTQVPLSDEAVTAKLSRIRQLTAPEQQAVQALYFLPRVDLVSFAPVFANFAEAEERLIQEPDESQRWAYFQRQYALFYARCRIIAEHLASHVADVTGTSNTEGIGLAWRLLQHLVADENKAQTPWEDDSGQVPDVTWRPQPSGGAWAALLGLAGTGLLGEFVLDDESLNWEDDQVIWADSPKVWRETRGAMDAFGSEENAANCPIPTVVPSMAFVISPEQLRFVGVRNGFALSNEDGAILGAAQGFAVHWHGVLLVDAEGAYEFSAGAPTPDGEAPDFKSAKHGRWRVTLQRGQKAWVLLSHHWPDTDAPAACSLPLSLKHGAYRLTVEFVQPHLDFDGPEDVCPQTTGFQLKYSGPDSEDQPIAIPLKQLFRDVKNETLASRIALPEGAARRFLQLRFTSSLRDIRRTYLRLFRSLLFAHRFGLSAKPLADDGQSEIGYMLAHADDFVGTSYFPQGAGFEIHRAFFDFNFLPVQDNYFPPDPLQDQRAAPSSKRQQALFDWWERIFDYTVMRRESRGARENPVWFLFHEAAEAHVDDPAHLLRHMGVDFTHTALVLRYYQNQDVTSSELEDERWAVRVWQVEKWLRCLLLNFFAKDIREARPSLWASDDPGLIEAGETQSGNANLTRFIRDGSFENGEPRRYEEVKRLNDGLREKGRQALLAYLCGMNRVPLPWGGFATEPRDLSELLLLDVEVGRCQRASRIEEAISAVQTFIQRARLGLESALSIGREFTLLWERHFATFNIWETCKRREIYRENWIDWEELHKAQRVEAFRFLEDELRRATLTIAEPGGLEYWLDPRPPLHPGLMPLQAREPAQINRLDPKREGFGLLGTPERDARPSWLASLREVALESPEAEAGDGLGKLPFWIQAAIRLGVRFIRVAAAGNPLASEVFEPRHPERAVGCCVECGKPHPARVDEYYFWLIDTRYYDSVRQDAEVGSAPDDTNSDWHRETELPKLLAWRSEPMVHLAWCRVHNGEFQQPRRSFEGVRIDLGSPSRPELIFLGRVADSLNFRVDGGKAPAGYTVPPEPGFRYDLADDTAVVLPLIALAPSAPTFTGALPVYPYFIYFEQGAPVMPPSLFAPSLAVAASLRSHCRFEAALRWYELVARPLQGDNTWCRTSRRVLRDFDNSSPPEAVPSVCCQTGVVSDDVARRRAILLHYLETLRQWGDALMCRNSPEAFQQARVIFDTEAKILGVQPPTVIEEDATDSLMTVGSFVPMDAPLNPRLLALYDVVNDRLALIHACLNARRRRNGQPNKDMPYWGNSDLRNGWETTAQVCMDEADWCYRSCCHPYGPYRFLFLVQKANELAGEVRALGAALQSAYEKGDAEYLASLRTTQERQLLSLTIEVRQHQWREADWQVQALRKTKEMTQANRNYFQELIDGGLNSGESQSQALTGVALSFLSAGMVSEAIGEVLNFIPDPYVGFPCSFTHLPVGTKLSHVFSALARISNTLAQVSTTTSSLRLTMGGWDRREIEWRHQVEMLDIEIEQIERQILASERRRDVALREHNNQQRQLEHAAEMQDFLRDKFTNHALFLWLQQETSAQHYQMYELAVDMARRAERSFNYERGHTARKFLMPEAWDNRHEGLLAGERLQLFLRQMESAYLEQNCREYELSKHISLRLHAPLAFLSLRETGSCEIEIPEWMFDLDYPGHYMRRIKNVSLTIPSVVGPYTGVHCRLTLLSSTTRVDPRLNNPPAPCCDDSKVRNGYEAQPDDPRIVRQYGALEAIATSSGQNDSGMFELNFRDERYLPFEFAGAISRWRIELPPENNQFDMDTLSDVILHLNYTAREGGDVLRRTANEIAQQNLPGAGVRFFEVKHELPDAWHQLQRDAAGVPRELDLSLGRNMFPYLPGRHDLSIKRVELLFEAAGAEPSAQRYVEFLRGTRNMHEQENPCACEAQTIPCIADAKWPCMFHGVLDLELGALKVDGYSDLGTFRFEPGLGEITNIYLFCSYEVLRKEDCLRDAGPSTLCAPVYGDGH